jgi:hypothetical protein
MKKWIICFAMLFFLIPSFAFCAGEPVQSVDEAKALYVEFLKVALDSIQGAKAFALEQAPLVFQDIVRWGIWYNGVWILVGLISFCGFLYCFGKLKFWIMECPRDENGNAIQSDPRYHMDCDEQFYMVAGPVIGVIVTFITFVNLTLCNLSDFIKAIAAPRLYIIDYLQHFLK